MKQKQEIATNVSSGAEKVERVKEQVKKGNNGARAVKKTVVTEKTPPVSTMDVEKVNAESTNGKAEKESKAAKARVEAALKKKEEKAAKLAKKKKIKKEKAAKKKALIEKRAAAKKAEIEKRAAAKKALAEKRKAKREEKLRERAHAKANRSQKKERAKNNRRKNKTENSEQRESKKGYGGWLAAVIALGAVTLALTTAVTVGAVDMKKTKNGMASAYRSTTYEIIGIMENVENDLDRARISNAPAQQGRILTDLLVQARLAELDLEKLPVSAEMDGNLTAFINRVAAESERMLSKLRNGQTLSARDEEVLQYLYEVNHNVREELGSFAEKMQDKDVFDYMKDGKGMIAEVLDKVEKATLGENRLEEQKKPQPRGAGMERSTKECEEKAKIDPAKAEQLCSLYFSEYNIGEFQCTGETVTKGYGAYNVQGYDDKGTMLFAEIDYSSGALLRFDYYEDCQTETFDIANAEMIAKNFLERLGYDDMTAVRVRENGTTSDFTFLYEDEGVVFYPDMIRVKVCRTRGVVTGLDATKYLKNHKDREEPTVKISIEEAKNKLHEGVEVEAVRLVVVNTVRGERPAYEFVCAYKGERYVIYTDAENGFEIAIVNVKNLG